MPDAGGVGQRTHRRLAVKPLDEGPVFGGDPHSRVLGRRAVLEVLHRRRPRHPLVGELEVRRPAHLVVLAEVGERADEQLFDRDGVEALLVRHLLARVELEVALVPAQQLQQQPVSLQAQRFEQLAALDEAALEQQVEQPLAAAVVLRGDGGEVARAHQPLAGEDLPQPLLHRLVEGVGGHHVAVLERDGDDVRLTLHGEDAGLPLRGDHLQDLRQLERL
jgi:hypothetical protein